MFILQQKLSYELFILSRRNINIFYIFSFVFVSLLFFNRWLIVLFLISLCLFNDLSFVFCSVCHIYFVKWAVCRWGEIWWSMDKIFNMQKNIQKTSFELPSFESYQWKTYCTSFVDMNMLEILIKCKCRWLQWVVLREFQNTLDLFIIFPEVVIFSAGDCNEHIVICECSIVDDKLVFDVRRYFV